MCADMEFAAASILSKQEVEKFVNVRGFRSCCGLVVPRSGIDVEEALDV